MFINLKKSKGAIDLKLFVTVVAIAFSLLALGIYLIYKNEKDHLSRQLNNTLKQKEELQLRLNETLKPVTPANQEIMSLRKTMPRDKLIEEANNIGKAQVYPTKQTYSTISDKNPQSVPSLATDRFNGAEKGLSRLRDYIRELEKESSFIKDKVGQLSVLLNKKEKDIEELNTKNIILKHELEKAINTQSDLKGDVDKRLNDLKAQIAQKESDVASLNIMKTNLENKFSELNNKLLSLADANSYLERQLAQSEKDRSSLEIEFKNLKEQMAKKTSFDDTSSKRIDELTKELNNREQERLNMVKELEFLKGSKKNLETELNELKLTKNFNENQTTQLSSRMNELNLSYESMRSALSQLSSLVAKREIELNDKKNELSLLKQNFEQTSKERDALLLTLREKEKTILELSNQLSRLDSKIVTLQAEFALAQERQKKTIDQLNQATTINTSLQERLLNISKDLEPVRLDTDQEKTKADELRKKVKVMLDLEGGK